jgi:hypothetical protein
MTVSGPTGEHERLEEAAAQSRLGGGQLDAVVDSQHLLGVGGEDGFDLGSEGRHHIGEIQLPLGVVRGEPLQGGPEPGPGEDIHSRVALRGRRPAAEVPLLDDPLDASRGVAHHPAEAGRIVRNHAQEDTGGAGRGVGPEEAAHGLRPEEREIAIGHDDRAILTPLRWDAANGVTGAARGGLESGLGEAAHGLHHVGLRLAQHRDRWAARSRPHRLDNVEEHRPPREGMEDFGPCAAHPGALPGGQDDGQGWGALRVMATCGGLGGAPQRACHLRRSIRAARNRLEGRAPGAGGEPPQGGRPAFSPRRPSRRAAGRRYHRLSARSERP